MKKIYLMLMLLMVGIVANAQRNLKFAVTVYKPATDTNIVTGSIQSPIYVIQNISTTVADSVAKGDSIYLKTPTNLLNQVGIIIPGQSLKKDSFLVLSTATVTGGYTVPFANIETLFNLTGDTLKAKPFTNNKRYSWYAQLQTVKAGPGNPSIASVTGSSDSNWVWINKSTSSVEEIAFEDAKTIQTYPNPAVSEVSFDYTFLSKSDASVRVLDASGRTVLFKDYRDNSGSQKFTVDITSLQTGMYFIQLMVGEKSLMAKFNVQK
jgi:hypothetical protein